MWIVARYGATMSATAWSSRSGGTAPRVSTSPSVSPSRTTSARPWPASAGISSSDGTTSGDADPSGALIARYVDAPGARTQIVTRSAPDPDRTAAATAASAAAASPERFSSRATSLRRSSGLIGSAGGGGEVGRRGVVHDPPRTVTAPEQQIVHRADLVPALAGQRAATRHHPGVGEVALLADVEPEHADGDRAAAVARVGAGQILVIGIRRAEVAPAGIGRRMTQLHRRAVPEERPAARP